MKCEKSVDDNQNKYHPPGTDGDGSIWHLLINQLLPDTGTTMTRFIIFHLPIHTHNQTIQKKPIDPI